MTYKTTQKCTFVNNNFVIISALITFLISNSVSAQETEGFVPSIDMSVSQNDNVFRDSDAQSATIFTVAPKLQLLELYEKFRLEAYYEGKFQHFADLDKLNHTDHDLFVQAGVEHTARLRTEFTFRKQNKIEEPGETNALTIPLDEFNDISVRSLSANISYGTRKSSGQVVLSFDQDQKRYNNNQQFFRDLDDNALTATFFYKAAPKTRILFEASSADIDYKNVDIFERSSSRQQYLVGVEWNASTITKSVFKIGYQDVDYANDQINDISGLSYFLDMYWRPNTYSIVRISANRTTQESAVQDQGGFITKVYKIGLTHELGARINLKVSYQHIIDDLVGLGARTDKKQKLSLSIAYSANNWLDIYAGVILAKRDSNLNIYDFDANQYRFGFVASFD